MDAYELTGRRPTLQPAAPEDGRTPIGRELETALTR